MRYVYILELIDSTYYVGSSPRLEERVKDHREGKCKSTKDKRPVKLHWYCCFRDDKKAKYFDLVRAYF